MTKMVQCGSQTLNTIDTAKESIRTKIAASAGMSFESLTAADVAREANSITSLSGRAALAALVQEKERAEIDTVKVKEFKERYAEWVTAGYPADDLTDDLGFVRIMEGK